jgi:hypothetical protein
MMLVLTMILALIEFVSKKVPPTILNLKETADVLVLL